MINKAHCAVNRIPQYRARSRENSVTLPVLDTSTSSFTSAALRASGTSRMTLASTSLRRSTTATPLSQREIADKLYLLLNTVKTHSSMIRPR